MHFKSDTGYQRPRRKVQFLMYKIYIKINISRIAVAGLPQKEQYPKRQRRMILWYEVSVYLVYHHQGALL